MSLKAFHILFLVVSTAMMIAFGAWAVHEYRQVGGAWNLILGVLAFAWGAAMIWYGKWFWGKIKDSKLS